MNLHYVLFESLRQFSSRTETKCLIYNIILTLKVSLTNLHIDHDFKFADYHCLLIILISIFSASISPGSYPMVFQMMPYMTHFQVPK